MTDEKGHIDARNALGVWSVVKLFGDTAFVLAGGGILANTPDVDLMSLVFLLWLWSLIKEAVDAPLVVVWAVGKWAHMRRKRARRVAARKKRGR